MTITIATNLSLTQKKRRRTILANRVKGFDTRITRERNGVNSWHNSGKTEPMLMKKEMLMEVTKWTVMKRAAPRRRYFMILMQLTSPTQTCRRVNLTACISYHTYKYQRAPKLSLTVEEKLRICTKERDKALNETLQYRTLAENLETDIKDVIATMHHRVTVVGYFWRNNVLEGRSRSGAILKRALTRTGH